MNRRTVLTSLGALGISALAGCNSDTGQPASSNNTTETTATSLSGTRTPTDRPEEATDSRLTVPDEYEGGRWRDVDYGGGHSPPAPPSTLSADIVRDVAAEAEEAHIYDSLENAEGVDSYGVSGYTVDPGAYVVDRNSDAVLVRVRLGYSFSCENGLVADDVSTATYRITTDEVERVDGTGIGAGC